MYMVLDKEKPGIGGMGGLNLAVVRHMTVKLFNSSFRVVK
jgi:hypothetical protein